jgi:carbon-monoxide dehydrogenase large subunit
MTITPKNLRNGRVEDADLLTGRGNYLADLRLPRMAAACFVRSPHAFAVVKSIRVDAARTAKGVLVVLTAADMAGIGNVSRPIPQKGRDGTPLGVPMRPALAGDRVCHSGEAVALVVAETLEAALDASELVEVDYEPLTPVIDVREAAAPGAPRLWPAAPGNIAMDWVAPGGDEAALAREIEAQFASAAHVARISVVNQRIVVASMEPRGVAAEFDAADGSMTLHIGSQGVTGLRDQMTAILDIPKDRLRVVTGDVGGGFGMKSGPYPEYAAVAVAARKLGRPVRWLSTRSEAFLSDNQARDTVTEMSLALDREGRFLALEVEVLANMGAYLTSHGAFISTANFARCLPCVYHIPRIVTRIRCVFSNTAPVGPYRGAGRPEANYALERLVDEAARVTGIDRVALRRRNLIAPTMLPYATPFGVTIDSGDFGAIIDEALARADAAGFAQRRARSEAAGKRRGLGISCFLEHAGGVPQESAAIRFPGDGTIAVVLGAQSTGQGHRTVFRDLAARQLDIPAEGLVVLEGDTRHDVPGAGTVASRGAMTSGVAVTETVKAVLSKGRKLSAHFLEASEADVVYANGNFEIAGTDRRISLLAVAEKARASGDSLDTLLGVEVPQSFPNGCHVAEVEIDPETGVVELVGYVAVDDCGTVLDHAIVEGQVHGAVAQGVGQVLSEDAIYDRASGQLLAGSFMDYAMPRADMFPDMITEMHSVPCKTNALGVKGVGEAGTTGALAAVMNAIADAIPGEAGAKLDMPATPLKVWQACRTLQAKGK